MSELEETAPTPQETQPISEPPEESPPSNASLLNGSPYVETTKEESEYEETSKTEEQQSSKVEFEQAESENELLSKTENEKSVESAEIPKVEDQLESDEIKQPSIEEKSHEALQLFTREKSGEMDGERARKYSKTSSKRLSIDVAPKEFIADVFEPRRPSQGSDRRRSSGHRGSLSEMKLKKFGGLTSKAKIVLGSIVDIKSNALETYDRKAAKYQNTYKLESNNPFNSEKVDKILKEVMEEVMENLQYDPDKCVSVARFASSQIRNKVKQLEFHRYKLVCIVSIGEKNSQDVYATCRFLWDPEKDGYSFYAIENSNVYAIAYCFGLYYE
ncbi:hypothetical protein ABEB36_002504 [Hypothenemus hampei]|uniref:Uncharacterized protein n=1 Tax=Hypothenemus hampei TaxID=57062 RepID=A0ABD1F7P3_HYPHA